MNVLIVGCGRVGSAIAVQLDRDGWNVSVIDQKEEALVRLGEHWRGTFVVGHGMDVARLEEAGIEDADAVVVATNGDNTNLVVAQVAQRRFGIECVVVRILDPARAEFYATQGLSIVCPTKTAIDELARAIRGAGRKPEPVEVA